MNHTEHMLEFDKVKEKWKDLAMTDSAKEEIENITYCLSERELSVRQKETSEAKIMLEKAGNPPLVTLSGLHELVFFAERGDCLSGNQLEEVGTALVAVKRLKSYLERCKYLDISLPYYEESLNPLEEIREMIASQIRGGSVCDSASRLLKDLRGEMERTRENMRTKAESVMRANKECMSDQFGTTRNGRICIPVKKEYKHRIQGSVIDKSATGNTLFMEPASVAKLFEELQYLKLAEEDEERRIRYTLSVMIGEEGEAVLQNIKMMEKLDFIFSKGKLSLAYDGVEPEINTKRRIRLVDGRHPLMDKSVCVPLQFQIGGKIRGIVITGPNTGGKTVAMKTVALNCLMAQCGLHVAAKEADICMNSNFLCDIGDGQNLSENLSTFSAHITNVLSILRKLNDQSLVIMDELGSGTDPAEGMGIAVAILEELKKSGALFVVTTHYPEVKQYADQEEGILNARMTFDKESLQPLYQMVLGEAGESCAFYIAGRLGMPEYMLRTAAKAAYGSLEGIGTDAGAEDVSTEDVSTEDIGTEDISMEGKRSRRRLPDGENQENKEQTEKKGQVRNFWLSAAGNELKKESQPRIRERKDQAALQSAAMKFKLGDSVMVYPDKKIGIVCKTANEKGVLQVQMPGKKLWINHKRIKLHVAASELYPEDYDFSILFDTVANRKLRHQMERKHMEGVILEEES